MDNEILKSHHALDVGLPEQFTIIDSLRAHYPIAPSQKWQGLRR